MTETKQRSELIDALLAKHGAPGGNGRASVRPCQGARHHSPTPLVTSCYVPFPDRQIWLCPTCLSKLQVFIYLHKTEPAAMTWEVMQQFGNAIRMLGQEITARLGSERTHDA